MVRKEIQEIILSATEHLLASATDLVLYSIFYHVEFIGRPTMNTAFNLAPRAAEQGLEKINYKTIKHAIARLLAHGLITKEGKKFILTNSGQIRLQKILPSLGKDLTRTTGEIYLVAYDISESARHGREALHWWLKKASARQLQKSLFLVITNPQEMLKQVITNQELEGEVLVIKLGENSLIAGQPIIRFLEHTYSLSQLNDRYQQFVKRFLNMDEEKLTPIMLDFAFNSIAKDDPMLPVEFLPKDWAGIQARDTYQKLQNNLLTSRSRTK